MKKHRKLRKDRKLRKLRKADVSSLVGDICTNEQSHDRFWALDGHYDTQHFQALPSSEGVPLAAVVEQ